MTKKPRKIPNEERIEKLLLLLNHPETGCKFWREERDNYHLMGVRPIKRTTLEIINKDGYNPLPKQTEEKLFKVFYISISTEEKFNKLNNEEIKFKNSLEDSGYIYLKHHDLIYIYQFIRENK